MSRLLPAFALLLAACGEPDAPPPPRGACGLSYGTEAEAKLLFDFNGHRFVKVYLDGEIDEVVTTLPWIITAFAVTKDTLVLDRGEVFFTAPWPPQSPTLTPDIVTGLQSPTVLGAFLGGYPTFYAMANNVVEQVDVAARTHTQVAEFDLSGTGCYPNQLLAGDGTHFQILAYCLASPQNRFFDLVVDTEDATTTEGAALGTDAPILTILPRDASDPGRSAWFDNTGFWLNGVRVRDYRVCDEATQQTTGLVTIGGVQELP